MAHQVRHFLSILACEHGQIPWTFHRNRRSKRMCLGPEFFDGRDALVLRREAEGDLELVHFLELQEVSLERLHELGLLRDDRICFSTADFFTHQITRKGARFMAANKDYQLIFVRRDDAAAFGTFLERAKGQKGTGPR